MLLSLIASLMLGSSFSSTAFSPPDTPLADTPSANSEQGAKIVRTGVQYTEVYDEGGRRIGYAQMALQDGVIKVFRFYEAGTEPPFIRQFLAANIASFDYNEDPPRTVRVGEDNNNVYMYTVFADGSYVYYAVNKTSGAVQVISSGKPD